MSSVLYKLIRCVYVIGDSFNGHAVPKKGYLTKNKNTGISLLNCNFIFSYLLVRHAEIPEALE